MTSEPFFTIVIIGLNLCSIASVFSRVAKLVHLYKGDQAPGSGISEFSVIIIVFYVGLAAAIEHCNKHIRNVLRIPLFHVSAG